MSKRLPFGAGSKDVTPQQWKEIRQTIVQVMEREGYDDGSLGPLFVRLAWHSCGSYSKQENIGGSNGAHIRFNAGQLKWGGNAGIKVAIDALEPVKHKFPAVSYADLYILSGVVAIEEMGGPTIDFTPGRVDAEDQTSGPVKDAYLPDGAKGGPHLQSVFTRMGFNDQELVALSGAHSLGRCHRDRSGFEGPWSRNPTAFTNQYYRLLLKEKWEVRQWDGPLQYTNVNSGKDLMMLPSDMALLNNPFKSYVQKYAEDDELFFKDFKAAFEKLITLGLPSSPKSKL